MSRGYAHNGGPIQSVGIGTALVGTLGNRRIDNVVDVLRLDTMPPKGMPDINDEDKKTLIDWATCGEGVDDQLPDGPRPGGYDVTRSLYPSPTTPADADILEFERKTAPLVLWNRIAISASLSSGRGR